MVQAVLLFAVAFIYANLGLGGGLLFVPILLSTGVTRSDVAVPISLTFTIATAASSDQPPPEKARRLPPREDPRGGRVGRRGTGDALHASLPPGRSGVQGLLHDRPLDFRRLHAVGLAE